MELFKKLAPVTDIDPERVHKSYMLNTNWFISMLWGVLKPFWPEHSRQRLVFVKDYEAEVLCNIDGKELPEELGGSGQYTIEEAIDNFPSRYMY
jgi:hypothetical protein